MPCARADEALWAGACSPAMRGCAAVLQRSMHGFKLPSRECCKLSVWPASTAVVWTVCAAVLCSCSMSSVARAPCQTAIHHTAAAAASSVAAAAIAAHLGPAVCCWLTAQPLKLPCTCRAAEQGRAQNHSFQEDPLCQGRGTGRWGQGAGGPARNLRLLAPAGRGFHRGLLPPCGSLSQHLWSWRLFAPCSLSPSHGMPLLRACWQPCFRRASCCGQSTWEWVLFSLHRSPLISFLSLTSASTAKAQSCKRSLVAQHLNFGFSWSQAGRAQQHQ